MEAAEGFELFVEIVERGSISAAAAAIGMPRETLSRRLKHLEQRLGMRLLHRSTRRLVLTPEGDMLYRKAVEVVSMAREAVDQARVGVEEPWGRLRISFGPGPQEVALSRLVAGFIETYPKVEVELLCTTRHVDLASEGVDVALRGGPLSDPNLVLRRIWQSSLIVVASPGFLDLHGRPGNLEEFCRIPAALALQDGHRSRRWPRMDGGEVSVDGPHATDSLVLRITLALRGQAMALVPKATVDSYLEDGRLEAVLPDEVGAVSALSIVFLEREMMLPKVRAFIDYTLEWFENLDSVEELWRLLG